MTAKEKRYLRKIEIEVEELRRATEIAGKRYTEIFHVYFDTRVALLQAFSALEEAAVIMHECIKDDPQFMAAEKRISVIPNF